MSELKSMKLRAIKKKYEILIFGFLAVKMSWPYIGKGEMFAMSSRFIFMVVLLVFISWISGRVIEDTEEKSRDTVLIMFALFFVSFASNSVLLLDLWYKDWSAIKNTAVIVLTLLSTIFINKLKIKWQIPIFCFLCTWIEPLYLFTFMPMVAILLFYSLAFNKTASDNKALCAAGVISSFAAFLLFGLKRSFISDLNIINQIASEWKTILLSLAVILPIIIIIILIWANTIRNSKDKVFNQFIMVMAAEPVVSVFGVVLKAGYINLIMTAVFVQFCFIFYLISTKNKALLASLEKTRQLIKNNWMLVFIIIVYLSCFSSFAKGFGKSNIFDRLWL